MMTKFTEILVSDKCFVLVTFSTMICYGMFWTIPGSLIYEIKTNINGGIEVFGYLNMILKIGKTAGHLLAIKVCGTVKPSNYPDIHLIFMAIQFLGVIAMPICTTWYILAICWSLIGITLGVLETNNVFFNSAMNHESAPKYTNFYYFTFSLGAALTPPIVDRTKQIIDDPKSELTAVCGIVGGVNFVLNFFAAAILKLRRDRGIVIGDAVEYVEDKSTSFLSPIVSNISLTIAACLFMVGRTVMELFLLPFALNASAGLTERTSYSLVQTVYIATMIIRLVGVFISPWLTKGVNTFLLIFWNFTLVLGIISMSAFRDNSYAGMIVTLIIFGLAFGAYQNSLLNWMTDRLAVNPKNTAPFFFGTCFGSSITPAVIPHLIENSDESIDVDNFLTIVITTFSLTVTFCGLLMLAELFASNAAKVSTVEAINLVPVVVRKRFNSYNSSQNLSVDSATLRNTSASLSQKSQSPSVDLIGASKSGFSVLTRRQNTSVSSLGQYTPLI